MDLIDEILKNKDVLPKWTDLKSDNGLLFHHNNGFFSKEDAITLALILTTLKPEKIVEVGSGWSTALMLDLKLPSKIVSIDKSNTRVSTATKNNNNGDYKQITEDIKSLNCEQLFKDADFILIDSEHNGRAKGAPAHIINELLPLIKVNTIVAFHDIYEDWLTTTPGEDGGEQAILRAFLQYNEHFHILLWLPKEPRLHFSKNYKGCTMYIQRVK